MSDDNEENNELVTSNKDEDPWYKYEHSNDLVQLCDKKTNDAKDSITNSLAPIYLAEDSSEGSVFTKSTVISECVDSDDPFVRNPELEEYCELRIKQLDNDRRKREIDIARFERWIKRTKYNEENNIDNTANDRKYAKYFMNENNKK